MLIPQFSLRWMLAAITLLAFVFLVAARAVQGSAWAVGVTAAVLMLAAVMLVHAGLFFLIWLVSQMKARRQRPAMAVSPAAIPATPFRTDASIVEGVFKEFDPNDGASQQAHQER